MPPVRRPVLIATTLGALAVFGLLASAVVRETFVVDRDERVSTWVATEMPSWAEWLARPFSWLGGWIGITATSIVIVAVLLLARRFAAAIAVTVSLVGIQLLTAVTKSGYDRLRPTGGTPVDLPSSSSFPSGHASGAVVTFGLAALVAAERWPERRGSLVWATVALSLAIGVSRVVLNVHFVSDVVAGWCLGLAWLCALVLVHDAVRHVRPGA